MVMANHLENQFMPNDQPNDPVFTYDVRYCVQDYLNGPTARYKTEFTSPREVMEIIKRLKNRKAPGYDDINNITIKNLPLSTVIKFTGILNACLDKSYFPSKWKTAKIILLPKPGKDGTTPEGYRPISLLPGLGKVYERVILRRMDKYMDRLPLEQFGFRKTLSTTKQLVRLVEFIGSALHNNQK
ncbi:putative RNA-directed DNA polymerase from transposon X-element, partial [Stegodyphus mimosarum]